jgi:hypothetical protein
MRWVREYVLAPKNWTNSSGTPVPSMANFIGNPPEYEILYLRTITIDTSDLNKLIKEKVEINLMTSDIGDQLSIVWVYWKIYPDSTKRQT